MKNKAIILFDNDCIFCNKSVQYILKRDKKSIFLFSGLNSEFSKKILKKQPYLRSIDSIILCENEKIYTHSSAVLKIGLKLNYISKIFSFIGLLLPIKFRDSVYQIIAKYRNTISQEKYCIPLKKEDKLKFLS